MMNENMEYMKKEKSIAKLLRTEILLAPVLIIIPIIIGTIFLYDWYRRGFLTGDPSFNINLILGLIIIIGNILFDIPFIKSLIEHSKEK